MYEKILRDIELSLHILQSWSRCQHLIKRPLKNTNEGQTLTVMPARRRGEKRTHGMIVTVITVFFTGQKVPVTLPQTSTDHQLGSWTNPIQEFTKVDTSTAIMMWAGNLRRLNVSRCPIQFSSLFRDWCPGPKGQEKTLIWQFPIIAREMPKA